MTIKQKLIANMALTSIGIILISGFSLAGMRFVQVKLHTLTEQSTPYQLKVYEQQRFLQEHIGNLLRFSVVSNPQELLATKQKADKTIATIDTVSRELAAFKGDENKNDSGLAGLKEITRELESAAAARITAYGDVQKALKLTDESLIKISGSLKSVDTAMKGSQKKIVTDISTANESFKRSSTRIKNTQQALGYLSDIKLSLTEISSAEGTEDVTFIRSNLDAALKSISASTFLKVEKGTKQANELSEAVATFHKTLPVMCDSFAASLTPRDEVKRSKALQDLSKALKLVNRNIKVLTEAIEVSNTVAAGDGKRLDETLVNTVAVSAQLANNGELVALGAELKALIRDLFSARTLVELEKTKNEIELVFNRAASLRQNLKAAAGIAGAGATFASIHETLFGKGGAYESLVNIVKVTSQAAVAAERLKGIVEEQQKHGETGAERARSAQAVAIKSVNTLFRTSIILVVSLGSAILLMALLLSKWISSSITGPIHKLSEMAEGFGAGDFNIRMDESRKDEFGTLAVHFNQATAKLSEITKLLKESITRLSMGSEKLHKTAEYLYKGAQEQVSQTMQSSVAMTEISATVETVAGNAHSAAASSKEAHSMATNGKAVVDKTVRGMRQISESVIAAATTISKLSESSERIDSILSTINDIADQTNLLALNAAIEAARAGEQGRGFAVVADEVRKLAQRTAEATHEIGDIIHIIQTDTERSVAAMNDGKSRVEEGMRLSSEASDSLDSIVGVSQRSVDMAQMIASATDDQTKASREVSQSMEKIAHITGALKDSTIEIKEASEELSKIADELNQMASWFKVTA